MTAYETLRVEADGPVTHITLNRPEARNAMSAAMVRELIAALRHAEQTGARVAVLRGTGGVFCAGADLKEMAEARATTPAPGKTDPVLEANAAIGELCAAYARTGIATVGILEGPVLGGGFGLSCALDVAIASETAVFRLPETSLGLIPAQIAPFLVERIGYSEAKRLSVTGGSLNAEEAYRVGLVHRMCTPDEVAAAAQTAIDAILACAPEAVAATKALLRRAKLEDAASLTSHAAQLFTAAARGPEGEEGLRAFREKRKPGWVPRRG
jgi:isohexenylglutaconyl-CoA hydratase